MGGQAGRPELTFERGDFDAFDAAKRQLAQRHPMHERRELLCKGMLEYGDHQHLLEAADLERVHCRQHMGHVGRVEASAVDCDRFPHPGARVYNAFVRDASTIRSLSDPVTIRHDGETLLVERGEMLAAGLIAAGHRLLARSPKLHRARGPYCLRGACDGCTARVNGVPNVMTCMVSAAEGDCVETQNVLGSRELDLYEATDLLFPRGFDHHRFFAGAGASAGRVLTSLARRMSGLGRLPERVLDRVAAERLEVDVLIVGGGAAGLTAAAVLGSRALLVDDGLSLGGALGTLEPARAAELVQRARQAGAELRHESSVLLLSREPENGSGFITAIVEGPLRASQLRCRRVLVASGAHDAMPRFGNNDAPGIFSARAALKLHRSGISLGSRVALLGDGRFARAFVAARESVGVFRFDPEQVQEAKGAHEVSRLVYRDAGRTRQIQVSAVVFDAPEAPAVELLAQLGAELHFQTERGYVPRLEATGLATEAVYAAGSCAASALPSEQDGARVARELAT